MHHAPLLQDLAIVLLVGAVVIVICRWLRQPVVLGYILAGLIIGPHTPPAPLITDEKSIHTLSELGVIMLMFSLGLDFSLRDLARVGSTALIAGLLEIALMIWIGYQIGQFFGWSRMDSVFLGAMLLSSSTVIIVKALNDLGLAREKFASVIFGILVVDDIAAIAALGVLSGIAISGSFSPQELMVTSGSIGLFLVAVAVLGLLIVPRLLKFIEGFKSDEVTLIASLGLGFGMALAAMKLGFSGALGAFMIGAVIAETPESIRIKALIAPVRDMFSAIFFVSVGLMLDPGTIREHWLPVLVITVTLVVGKIVTGALGTFVAGHDTRTSLRVGMGLAQIGEFSFIMAALGRDLGVTSDFLYPIGVAASGITTLSTPFLIKHSDRLAAAAEDSAPKSVRNVLAFYSRWVAGLQQASTQNNAVRQLLWRWGLQVGLNLALITALFVAAGAAAPRIEGWAFPNRPGGPDGHSGLSLLATLVLALPMIIAVVRKLRAMARLISETTIRRVGTTEQTEALRRVMTQVISGGGAGLVLVYLFLLSSAMLPSWPVLAMLCGVVCLIAAWRWRLLLQLYARAQISLKETFDAPSPGGGHGHGHAADP
ncbi:MAG: cation:proton antiporter [Planctomycetota bacterium]|nr:cation:proton antiporter [Planctomycetota bacterium]